MQTIRKAVEDIAVGDYIKPNREWFLVRGPISLNNGTDFPSAPITDRTGIPGAVLVFNDTIAAAPGCIPEPFTPAGLRRAAKRRQDKIDQLTAERDRMRAFADAQDEALDVQYMNEEGK